MTGLSKTDRQWVEWSSKNPYLGVLGVETGAMSNADSAAAFFDTGERDIGRVIALIERHFGGLERREAALDFGCGVGRLLGPLAQRFERVTGIDVAPKMLELARGNCARFSNVDLMTTDRLMDSQLGSFDFVHSFIVLQHIRPQQGMPIIGRLLDLVRPGGCFALHFTTGDHNPKRRLLNWFRYRVPPIHWLYNTMRRRPWNEPITEMNRYDPVEVLLLMRTKGCPYAMAVPFDHTGHGGIMFIGKVASSPVDNWA